MTLTTESPVDIDKTSTKGTDNQSPKEDGIPNITPLTDRQKDIIHSTVPILVEHGETITRLFYKNMLLAHPDLRNVFSRSSQETGHQAKVLAQSVHAYAVHIHVLTPLLPVVQRIAHKHASVHITPDQYAIVGKHLIEAIAEVLGDGLSEEVAQAWISGYWNLAKIFIDTEKGIYESGIEKDGWEGFKEFKIVKKQDVTEQISHFLLRPVGETRIPKFQPGQYISVKVPIPSLGIDQIRQYSISDVHGSTQLRISVRRDDSVDTPPGLVSTTLHTYKEGDTIQISSPFGEFHLRQSTKTPTPPLIFLSAGIGQTPLFPILKSCITDRDSQESLRKLTYATVVRDHTLHPFKQELKALQAKNDHLRYIVFHSKPLPDEKRDIDYHFCGRMKLEKMRACLFLDDQDSEYYLCGPAGFIVDIIAQLKQFDIPESRIHYELFSAGSPS